MALSWSVLALGFGLGLSLAAPPGPILALSAQRTVAQGFWPGLAVPLGASAGDGTYAVLMGAGMIRLLEGRETLQAILTLLGAVIMVFFAYSAWKGARRPPLLEAKPGATSGERERPLLAAGFLAGYTLALTSPYNLGWWLGAGTTLFADHGVTVFLGFFSALVAFSVAFVALVRWASGRVRGIVSLVSYASAFLLLAFAAWLARDALGTLG